MVRTLACGGRRSGRPPDRSRVRAAAVCFAAVLALSAAAGCGVPTEHTPRPIPPAATSASADPPTSAGEESGPVVETLYFVRDSNLVAVRRAGPRLPSAEAQLEHLLAGPTATEHDDGLSSALTGLGITARLRIEATAAVVELRSRPDRAGRSDEVLAYGQIVCTLTARSDIETVVFHYDGQPVDVPRGDGSLGRRPLAASDYASLVVVP